MSDQNQTVAQSATAPEALPLSETALIGVVIAPDRLSALLRLPNGRIAQAEPGARIAGETVTAIDEAGIVLARNGQTRRLKMPQR